MKMKNLILILVLILWITSVDSLPYLNVNLKSTTNNETLEDRLLNADAELFELKLQSYYERKQYFLGIHSNTWWFIIGTAFGGYTAISISNNID